MSDNRPDPTHGQLLGDLTALTGQLAEVTDKLAVILARLEDRASAVALPPAPVEVPPVQPA